MGFLLVCLYVAVLLLRPQEWYDPIKGYELVNIIAIPTILIAFIQQSKRKAGGFFLRNRFSQAMLGLFASVMLSQLVRLRISGAVDAVREFGKIVILFYLVAILVNTPRRVRIMMWVIIGSSMILAYHTYLQVQTGHGFGNIEPYGSFDSGDFRVIGSGIFADPNDFAMLYLMAMPFAFCLLAAGGAIASKLLLLGTLPPMVYVLYYTQSRGGVIGFCAMFIAYFWTTTKNLMIRVFLLITLLSVIAFFGPEARPRRVRGRLGVRTHHGVGVRDPNAERGPAVRVRVPTMAGIQRRHCRTQFAGQLFRGTRLGRLHLLVLTVPAHREVGAPRRPRQRPGRFTDTAGRQRCSRPRSAI